MTNEQVNDEDIAARAESDMFTDALLNGDEKWNKFVKLVDTRFESNTRRVNKLRQESRDRDTSLRRDLGPLIAIGKILPAFGGLGTLLSLLYVLHAYGVV